MSTNVFGGVAGAATSTAISANTNAVLVADVVEKAFVAETAQAVVVAEINIVANATQRLLPAVIDKSTRAEYSPLLMKYPSTVAVKMAVAETVGKALAKEVVKGAVTGVAEVNLTSHTAQQDVVRPAVKVKKAPKTPEEIARNIAESKRLLEERKAQQKLEGIVKKEEAKLSRMTEGAVVKPSKYISYEVYHPEHCPLESGELMGLWHNDPPKLMLHPLITFEPSLDIDGAKHVLSPEITRKIDQFGNVIENYSECHFNPNDRMAKYLSDVFVDKVTGVVEATVSYKNITPVEGKTFFPFSWTVKQVFYEIKTTMLNSIIAPVKDGKYIVYVGKGSGGVNVRMVFEETGRLVTAYPSLKEYQDII